MKTKADFLAAGVVFDEPKRSAVGLCRWLARATAEFGVVIGIGETPAAATNDLLGNLRRLTERMGR